MSIRHKKLWIAVAVVAILSPLGLIIPGLFKAGGAWGEWGAEEIKEIIGYVPEGLKELSGLWNSPIPDYAFKGWDEGLKGYVSYILAGIIGIISVIAISYLLGKALSKRKNGIPR